MKRRAPALPDLDGASPPPALLLGACVEVWGDGHTLTAFTRYGVARRAFEAGHNLDVVGSRAVLGAPGGPWSLSAQPGRIDRTEIDALRNEAQRLTAEAERLLRRSRHDTDEQDQTPQADDEID